MTWEEVQLGDVLEFKRGYDLPERLRTKGTIPVVSSSGVSGTHNEAKAKGPGVVTGRYGTIGGVFYVEDNFWPLNTTLYVRDFKGNDPKFISYFLREFDFSTFSGKSAVPGLNRNHLHQEYVRLAPKDEQPRIAEILASLDEKIELNRKQNRTLETIAQALFKRWFVEFEFPDEHGRPYKSSGGAMQPSELGEIPLGWEVKPLSKLVEINSWTLNVKDDLEHIDYIEISEVNRGEINEISRYQRGMEPSRAKRRLKHGDSVVSTVRPDRGAHFLALNPEEYLIASTGFAVLTGRQIPWSLVHAFITQDSVSTELGRLANGGAYPAVRPEVIGSFPLVVPKTGSLLDQFHAICSSLYEKADHNRKTSRSLGMLRDTVLPKLMSGELRVPEARQAGTTTASGASRRSSWSTVSWTGPGSRG